MTSIGPSSLAYSFGKSRKKLVLFVTIWAFQHSSRKTKHLCALMEPKQGFECGSWVNRPRILDWWDEMVRAAGSIKLGWVTASLLVQKLQAYPQQNALARA